MSTPSDIEPRETAGDAPVGKSLSRRALLKRAAVSAPAVLTLHSGAALARSSNLISGAPPYSRDSKNRTLCLNTNSVRRADRRWRIYDLGDPPYAHVNALHERRYARLVDGSDATSATLSINSDSESSEQYQTSGQYFEYGGYTFQEISVRDACENGGEVIYRDRYRRLRKVNLPRRGMIVSATALSSFSGRVYIKDI